MKKVVCIIFLCIMSGCSSKPQSEEYIPVIDKEIMPLDDAYEELELTTAGDLYEKAQSYLNKGENFIFDSTEKCFRSVDKGNPSYFLDMTWHFENHGTSNRKILLEHSNKAYDFTSKFYYTTDEIHFSRDGSVDFNVNLVETRYDSFMDTLYDNTIFDRIDKNTINKAFSKNDEEGNCMLYIKIHFGSMIDLKSYKTNILSLFGPDTVGSVLNSSDDTVTFEFTLDSESRFSSVKYAYQVYNDNETITFVNELSNFRYNTEKLVFPEGMEDWPKKGDEWYGND